MHDFSDLSPDQQRQVRRAAEARGMTPRELLRLVRASQAERLAVLDGHHEVEEEAADYYAGPCNAENGIILAKASR